MEILQIVVGYQSRGENIKKTMLFSDPVLYQWALDEVRARWGLLILDCGSTRHMKDRTMVEAALNGFVQHSDGKF